MTRVAVVYATKMGGTRGIAEAIGEELERAGCEATVVDAQQIRDLDGYDAAVVGSALYATRWRPEALKVLIRQAERGTTMPVWLFQSGPCDYTTNRAEVKVSLKVQRAAASVGAEPPITFGGRIELSTAKGFIARRMAKGPLGGDYRDFDVIREWARGIAARLSVPTSPPPKV